MTDHERLREAIQRTRAGTPRTLGGGMPRGPWQAVCEDDAALILAAAESTLPKTAMVNVWHVEYCYLDPDLHLVVQPKDSEREAGHAAARLREEPNKYLCVHVTGPHQQEVPA